jgi:hypothetical protein
MSTKFIIFIVLFFILITALFTIYSLLNPDAISALKNIGMDSVIAWIFYGFIAIICLAILGFILFLILADPTVSTTFWITIHLILILLSSPYFVLILLIGIFIYTGSTAKNATNAINNKANALTKSVNDSVKNKANALTKSVNNSVNNKANALTNLFKKKEKEFSPVLIGGEGNVSEWQKFITILKVLDKQWFNLWEHLFRLYTIQRYILEISKQIMYIINQGIQSMKTIIDTLNMGDSVKIPKISSLALSSKGSSSKGSSSKLGLILDLTKNKNKIV